MNRRTIFSISGTAALALAVFSATAVAQSQASCTATAEIVCTEQGAIRGAIEGQTLAFKGIPYGRPPLGTLRWKPPVAPPLWEGVREGSGMLLCARSLSGNRSRAMKIAST
jgi:Carboxylesterase family